MLVKPKYKIKSKVVAELDPEGDVYWVNSISCFVGGQIQYGCLNKVGSQFYFNEYEIKYVKNSDSRLGYQIEFEA